MEIDGGTIMVSIICVALLALPFALDYRRRTKKRGQLLRALGDLAQEHQCRIHQHGSCSDVALGLDVDRSFLFFFSLRGVASASWHLDLSQIRACQVVKTKRSGKGMDPDARLEQVEMSFLPKDHGKSATRLVLYSETFGFLVEGEEQFADKWSQLINDRLKN